MRVPSKPFLTLSLLLTFLGVLTPAVRAQGSPVIQSFTASPDSIAPGEPVNLAWVVTNATLVKLNGVPAEGAALAVNPIVTTQYRLEASNANGSVTATADVTVSNTPDFSASEGRFVEVVKHTVDTRLHLGEIEVFALGVTPDRADADGTSSNDLVQANNASPVVPPTTVQLEHGVIGTVLNGVLEAGGAVWSTQSDLDAPPRYMLDLGATYPIAQVFVWGRNDACCADRLQDFSVNVYADNGAGMPGELVHSVLFPDTAPEATVGPAEFDLTIANPGVRSFAVDKQIISAGEPIELSWEVSLDATEVLIDSGVGEVTHLTDELGLGSIVLDPGPTFDTTFTILVTRPTGNSVGSLMVSLTQEPVIHSFEADQLQIEPGTPVTLSWEATNFTTVELDGVGVAGTGQMVVNPLGSTDYELIVRNGAEVTSQLVRIRVLSPGEPIISEFMANNRDAKLDVDGDSSDWIELCNPGAVEARLEGYFLTDNRNQPAKWRIPNVVLPPRGYLLIFASGKDRSNPAAELHTNFALDDRGEYLALVKPDGASVVVDFHPGYPVQRPDVSYGFEPGSTSEGFFISPSPGLRNAQAFTGFVGDTAFSVDRGFFDAPIALEITTSEPGAQIRYTIDGTEPTAVRGLIYTRPITISSTTIVRAAGFKTNFVPTNVDTQTYLFTDDIIRQRSMSTSITQHPTYGRSMAASLKSIPSISLVFQGDVARTEKVCSAEFIDFEAGSTQLDAGMVRFGSYVTDFPKRGMRLTFRSAYGPSKLRFPIFDGHEYNIEPAAEVDSIDLRAGNHDMNARGAYMSNRFTDDSMDAMGNIAPHGRFVHVYLNGSYWGQYHLRERWNAAMLAEYFPGRKEEYEAVNANNTGSNFLDGVVNDGSGRYWTTTKTAVRGPNPYQRAGRYLDFANVIDFMLLWVSGNSESEFRSAGSVPNRVPFKFFMKDADGFLRSPGHPANHQGPLDAMARLMADGHPDYKILLADRIHKHFFNDGALTPAKNMQRLRLRTGEIRIAFYAESARWGYRTPSAWQSYQSALLRSHFPSLTQTMITRFKAAGMYPNLEAPSFSMHGGAISAGFGLEVTAPTGTIYYTTDGTDPRVSQTGAVSAQAVAYTEPIVLNETVLVKSRVLNGADWSALNEATFALDTAGLVVSEFMYDPLPPSTAEIAAGHTNSEDFEFFELLNAGTATIDLNGVVLDEGIQFEFATGAITTLAPGERLLVVEDSAAFEFRYGGGLPITGQYTGKLDDSGEAVRITNALNAALIQFTYDNNPPWPVAGNGISLVLIDPASAPNHNDPASWAASTILGGSPGVAEVLSFTYADWAAANGVAAPDGDDDGDGLTNFEEFLRGSLPLEFSPYAADNAGVEFLQVGPKLDAYLTLSFTYSLSAGGVTTTVQASAGLENWTSGPGSAVHLRTVYHGDGTATETWRSALPVSQVEEQFLRVLWANE